MVDIICWIFVFFVFVVFGGNVLMCFFSIGMVIFDGVMLGMKMICKVCGFFWKRY